MRNAFNSLRRDSFLSVARVRTPGLYSLLWQAYSSPTRLFFGEEGFASETGIQQGDPIGPALFALSVDEAARGVQSEFNVWYLDDATLGPQCRTWQALPFFCPKGYTLSTCPSRFPPKGISWANFHP